jgi:hypothetical protein
MGMIVYNRGPTVLGMVGSNQTSGPSHSPSAFVEDANSSSQQKPTSKGKDEL